MHSGNFGSCQLLVSSLFVGSCDAPSSGGDAINLLCDLYTIYGRGALFVLFVIFFYPNGRCETPVIGGHAVDELFSACLPAGLRGFWMFRTSCHQEVATQLKTAATPLAKMVNAFRQIWQFPRVGFPPY